LFVRRPHGLEPTHHALGIAPAVELLIREASNAVGLTMRFDPATTTRQFRIGAPEHLSSLIAAPLLTQFEQQAPGAGFNLRTEIGENALKRVRHDQIDVAVGQFLKPDVGLASENLYEDDYALVLRRGHPQVRRRATRAGLGKLTYVAVSPTADARLLTDEDFQSQGVQRRVIATVPRFQTAFEVVSRTNFAVVAPRRLAEMYVTPFRLMVLKLPIALRRLSLLLVRRTHPDPGVDWLAGNIRRALG
jgi:DNA-binding transcriptional LysR family regulator